MESTFVGAWSPGPSGKIKKSIEFLSNTVSDSLKNHKATKPAFYDRPSSASQRNAISVMLLWRAVIVLFGSSLSLHQIKKKKKNVVGLDPL